MDRRNFLATAAASVAATPNLASAQAQSIPRRVLWAANVRTKTLPERLEAAQAGRFDAMSVFPIDYKGWRASGLSATDIRNMIDAAGIDAAILDPFVQWVPSFQIPDGYPKDYVAFIDTPEDQAFEIAEALRARQINSVEGLNQSHERTAMIDAMGAFADRAAARGVSLTLEPMPISTIVSLADGWDLVSAVDHPALSLCFDTWHFWRADPDHTLLRRIPPDRIGEVQLADARATLNGDMTNDLLHHRLMPGDGDFDLERTVDVLKDICAWRSVGPELFSDAMDELAAAEAGRRTGASLDFWLK